jgi:hypothetical protein
MNTWNLQLKYYEFMLWDTKRFDIDSTIWTKQSFETQIWASVCDYIRLYAVYNFGGIYLDMDMEVLKTFENLLQNDLMLAYENHISKNIEAGCFGAVKGHPYILKCMEYLKGRDFCDSKLLPHVMKMKRSDRHVIINPPILPEIMKLVLQESFSAENYPIFQHDFFTAKNVVTGKIETTPNTITIHHFASQYHSEEWRQIRSWEQHIKLRFGETTILSNIICGLAKVKRRIRKIGILGALKYYFGKYFTKKEFEKI